MDDAWVRISEGVLSHLDDLLGGPAEDDLDRFDTTSFGVAAPLMRVAERFDVVEKLGHGGMSEVYRAVDTTTRREVALKIQNAGEAWLDDRFDREVFALAGLRHPNLVEYVAHGTTADGLRWVATEVLEGESLADRLARGTLGVRASLRIAADVLEALDVLHARGFVHRDVKPGNVFVATNGHAKLLDLGLLGAAPDASVAMVALTDAGALLGTVGYLSPEQGRGERGVDRAADVFAVGCVLFECITGALPFGRTLAESSAAFAMRAALPAHRLRRVAAPVRQLLREMLEMDAAARPRDAFVLSNRMRALAEPAVRARIDLVWFDATAIDVIRELVVDDPSLDARSAVARVLARGEATAAEAREPSSVVLVEGLLALSFDPRARDLARRALVEGLSPLAAAPAVAVERLVDAALLEQRAFSTSAALGGSTEATLTREDGTVSRLRLPEALAKALPLQRSIRVRMVAVTTSSGDDDGHGLTMRPLALARVVELRR